MFFCCWWWGFFGFGLFVCFFLCSFARRLSLLWNCVCPSLPRSSPHQLYSIVWKELDKSTRRDWSRDPWHHERSFYDGVTSRSQCCRRFPRALMNTSIANRFTCIHTRVRARWFQSSTDERSVSDRSPLVSVCCCYCCCCCCCCCCYCCCCYRAYADT